MHTISQYHNIPFRSIISSILISEPIILMVRNITWICALMITTSVDRNDNTFRLTCDAGMQFLRGIKSKARFSFENFRFVMILILKENGMCTLIFKSSKVIITRKCATTKKNGQKWNESYTFPRVLVSFCDLNDIMAIKCVHYTSYTLLFVGKHKKWCSHESSKMWLRNGV